MRLDPRVRLYFVILLTTLAVLAKDAAYLSAAVLAAMLINLILRINILSVLKKIKGLLTLIIFISIVQSIFVKGGLPLVYIKNFTLLSTKGLLYGAEFLLRMSVLILAGLIAASGDSREMADGLIKLKIPYELAFMTVIAINYLPALKNEFSTRLNAITLRGIEIKKLSAAKKIKLYSYLFSPVLAGSILKSRALASALAARAFGAEKKRTMYRKLKLTFFDWSAIIVATAFGAAYLYFMYTFGGII